MNRSWLTVPDLVLVKVELAEDEAVKHSPADSGRS